MSWDKGFNFRATSGYVTDSANESPVLGETYPTTYGNSAVAGWTSGSPSTRDRDSGVDRRLAGVNFTTDGTFQVDLPAAGTYNVSLAMGDMGNIMVDASVVVKDGATALLTIGPHGVTNGTFYDAADVNYSAANWPGSNSAASLTFSGTTMNVQVVAGGGNNGEIAHLFVSQTGGGGGGTTQQVFYRRKR